ncbi:MAG: glycosyltransferase [Candidatus Hadarchaeales archaeon]
MKVSVIIPTLNEGERIRDLLRSLKEAPYPDKEIIVVDGGSKDDTVKIARKEGAKVLQEEGSVKGPGNAKNQGARAAKGEVVCFVDADERGVNKEFFEKSMRHFQDREVVAVLTRSEILPSTTFRKWYLSMRSSTFSKLVESGIYGPSFSFTFIRRDLFLELGGFSPTGAGEDDALNLKLRKYLDSHPSKRWVYEPGAVRFDGSALTFQEYFRQSVWYGKSALPYFKVSERGFFSKLVIAVGPLLYLFPLPSLLLIPLSRWFLLPFLLYSPKLALLMWDTLKDRKIHRLLLTPLMDLVKGYGHLLGLLKYFFKREASRG